MLSRIAGVQVCARDFHHPGFLQLFRFLHPEADGLVVVAQPFPDRGLGESLAVEADDFLGILDVDPWHRLSSGRLGHHGHTPDLPD